MKSVITTPISPPHRGAAAERAPKSQPTPAASDLRPDRFVPRPKDDIGSSPRLIAQREQIAAVERSPRAVAQRQRLRAIFPGTAPSARLPHRTGDCREGGDRAVVQRIIWKYTEGKWEIAERGTA